MKGCEKFCCLSRNDTKTKSFGYLAKMLGDVSNRGVYRKKLVRFREGVFNVWIKTTNNEVISKINASNAITCILKINLRRSKHLFIYVRYFLINSTNERR